MKVFHLTEAAYEAQLTQKWLEGQAHGVEIAANRFRDLAAKFFQDGQDAKAKQFRDELPHLLKALQKELEADADRHERDHVEGLPPVLDSSGLVKTVLAKAAEEVMDEDSWPSVVKNGHLPEVHKALWADMKTIADNIEALDVDPDDLLTTEPP